MTKRNCVLPTLTKEAIDFLRALASETRTSILILFASSSPMTVSQVSQSLGMVASTTSEHLALMKRAGILISTRKGKETWYQPDRDFILKMLDDLKVYVTLCCPRDPANAAPSKSSKTKI